MSASPFALVAAALLPLFALAEPEAPALESRMDRMYDAATVVTVEGIIVAAHRRLRGPHDACLVVLTAAGTVDVHLGPVEFVDRQALQLATGDRVRVRGSRVVAEGAPAIIAASVTRGDGVLALRGDDGRPRWIPGDAPGTSRVGPPQPNTESPP